MFQAWISNCANLLRVETNRTEPEIRYSHLLECFSVTYRSRNAAHIHSPFNDVIYNIQLILELTMMSIVCSIVFVYFTLSTVDVK